AGPLAGSPRQPPVIGGPLGWVPRDRGAVAGCDPATLSSFVAFTSPTPVAALGATSDGRLVAALAVGQVELLERDPSGQLEAGQALAPATGIPSEPSALEVLEDQTGLRVLVTSAGLDTLFVFDVPALPGVTLPPPPSRVE